MRARLDRLFAGNGDRDAGICDNGVMNAIELRSYPDDEGASPHETRNDMTQRDRDMTEYYMAQPRDRDEARTDALCERSKVHLLHRYGLQVNPVTGMIEPNGFEIHDEEFQYNIRRLLNETMLHIGQALISASDFNGTYGSSQLDDSGDYLNATTDQLTWVQATFSDDDGEHIAELTLALLNATRDELEARSDGGYPDLGFIYGYADHYTPISELAAMNIDDEDDDDARMNHPVHGD